MQAEAAAEAAGAGPFGAIMGGLGLVTQIGSLFGARSARKKQERFIKQMMADRAKRIAEAKGEYDKSRRGLLAENRAAMKAQLGAARGTLGPALMASTASANLMRRVYGDFARRAAEIGRQTAAGKADLAMLSPYDIVDPSTMGQGRGAEMQALSGLVGGLANFGTSLYNAYNQQSQGKALAQAGAAMPNLPFFGGAMGQAMSFAGNTMQDTAFGSQFGK